MLKVCFCFFLSLMPLALFASDLKSSTDLLRTTSVVSGKKGGRLVFAVNNLPKSLNYLVSGEQSSENIFFLVVESLCERDARSGELVPLLAKSWSVSKNQKEFVFSINENARFSDGRAVTADDFLTYWQIVQNPENLVGGRRTELDNVLSFEKADRLTLKVTVKEVRHSNLSRLCKVSALDRDFFLAKDSQFNSSFNLKLFGSGPYQITKVRKGHEVRIERNPGYWGRDLPQNKDRYNFDKIIFKKVADRAIRFELFKKGEIDMFVFSMAKRWKQQTNTHGFKKKWLVARRIENRAPVGFSGVMLNTRLPLFSDRHVREGLAHTFHRKKFIEELFFDSYKPLSSYYPNSSFENLANKKIVFDLNKARGLLAQAGWNDVNSEGWLTKANAKSGHEQVFSFRMLYTSKTAERYLTTWKADLKKIGVQLNIELITWPALAKLMENYNYQAAWMGFSGNFTPDPLSNWHSKFKDKPHGNNYSGFSTPELDRLIELLDSKVDSQGRISVFQEIDKILFANHPFILSWYLGHIRLGYWNKFGFLSGGGPRFVRAEQIWQYAWLDVEKAKELTKARSQNLEVKLSPQVRGPHDSSQGN